jgi:hypothetical protein
MRIPPVMPVVPIQRTNNKQPPKDFSKEEKND